MVPVSEKRTEQQFYVRKKKLPKGKGGRGSGRTKKNEKGEFRHEEDYDYLSRSRPADHLIREKNVFNYCPGGRSARYPVTGNLCVSTIKSPLRSFIDTHRTHTYRVVFRRNATYRRSRIPQCGSITLARRLSIQTHRHVHARATHQHTRTHHTTDRSLAAAAVDGMCPSFR